MPGCSRGSVRPNTSQLTERQATCNGQDNATLATPSATVSPASHSGTYTSTRSTYWPTHTRLAMP